MMIRRSSFPCREIARTPTPFLIEPSSTRNFQYFSWKSDFRYLSRLRCPEVYCPYRLHSTIRHWCRTDERNNDEYGNKVEASKLWMRWNAQHYYMWTSYWLFRSSVGDNDYLPTIYDYEMANACTFHTKNHEVWATRRSDELKYCSHVDKMNNKCVQMFGKFELFMEFHCECKKKRKIFTETN